MARSVLHASEIMVVSRDEAHAADESNSGFRIGDLVAGYRVERLLGSGGMGWVFAVREIHSERLVALKVLRLEQLRLGRARERMRREGEILASITHPGVPRCYGYGDLPDDRPWIAMELVEGASLTARLARGALAAAEVAPLLASVATVLDAAHRAGVTHRDLKPDNLFLTPRDPRYPVRVVDWGIAHQAACVRYTNYDEAMGTPSYMAPEQARGLPPDGCSDVYSLGVVAYQALTGRPPFVGSTSVQILVQHLNRPTPPLAPRCPDAPIDLVALVERMLAKDFEQRPSAAEVCALLAHLQAQRRGSGAFPQ